MKTLGSLALLSLAVSLLLSSCKKSGGSSGSSNIATQPNQPIIQNLRPSNSPDVFIISVSGANLQSQHLPNTSTPYLSNYGDAAEAVEDYFGKLGNTTSSSHFISSLFSYDDINNGKLDRRGFLGPMNSFIDAYTDWINGYENPTRKVIIAHSHGWVWAHMATNLLPQIPIEYIIRLDGNSLFWTLIHKDDIDSFYSRNGNPFPWDIRYPCYNWNFPDLSSLQDIDDAVMPNIGVNLEVHSTSTIRNKQPNLSPVESKPALDGGEEGIGILHFRASMPRSWTNNWALLS